MPACQRFRTRSGRSPARRRRSFRTRNRADSAATNFDCRPRGSINLQKSASFETDGWPGQARP
jgi:hypothetical protein